MCCHLRQFVQGAQDGSVSVGKKANEKLTDPEEIKKTHCPRCGRKLSWLEREDGTSVLWCFWDQSPFLNTVKSLGGNDDESI